MESLKNTEIYNNSIPIKRLINKRIFLRIFLFLSLLTWCIGFSINPLFPKASEMQILSPILRKLYSSVCYQDELKTFTIYGKKLLVCIRCTGIYFGALSFSFISIFFKTFKVSRKLLVAALAGILSDIILYTTSFYSYSKIYAFVTGFFFGSAAFLYILLILENEFLVKK